MDTMLAFARVGLARKAGNKRMVFDWNKAAKIIVSKKATNARAGLRGDWEWTGGSIFRNGEPDMDDYTYLASIWAKPELEIDGEIIECWIMQDESPEWDSKTKWPKSALALLKKR